MVSATNSQAGVDVSTPRSNSTRRQPRELARSSSRAKVRDGPAHPVELRGDQHVGFTSSRSSASASAGRRMFFPVSPASVTISNVRRHTRSEGPAARWNRRSSTVRPRRQHPLTPPTARPLAVQQPTQRPAQRGLLNRSDPARPVASGPAGRRLARSRRFRQASGGYACARHRRVAGKPR